MEPIEVVSDGQAVLGIEFGSTRIKASLIDPAFKPIASGSFAWENQYADGVWTYALDSAWDGLKACYADLADDVERKHGVQLKTIAGLGISGMMHGYIALDAQGNLLTPFRTWRNNITGEASKKLSERFAFPIPQRWSIAHLYQAILNNEEHVSSVARITTLAGYIHWKLTGSFVLGPDEASGMFPVDPKTLKFEQSMVRAFDELAAPAGFPWKLADLLPEVRSAGESGGALSSEGALLMDPTGQLRPGVPMCPPEGDAGTGMVATNSVRKRTGNVSAGTSVFAMIVLEESLQRFHPEIDLVLTPDGSPVAMAHSNNCSSDLDAWMGLFGEVASTLGAEHDQGELFSAILPLATGEQVDADAGGLTAIPYLSGEHVTGFEEGRPLLVRGPGARFSLANFVRAQLFGALSAMRIGLDILTRDEGVGIDEIRGHGGFFKTPIVGQRIMASAVGAPCSVMETAGEGGSWGVALLAAFMLRDDREQGLPDFLDGVFSGSSGSVIEPEETDVAGFEQYLTRYMAVLAAERAAVEALPL